MPAKSPRNHLLDYYRGLALIGVILTHYLASLPGDIYYHHPLHIFFLSLNLACRFSVPLFVALSGYTLASTQSSSSSPWTFYRKRLFSLLPLYIFWSLILYHLLAAIPAWSINLPPLNFINLLFGHLDYHLYYVPMLISLYLFFPIIIKLAQSQPVTLLISGLWLQACWYYFLQPTSTTHLPNWFSLPQTDQAQYLIPLSWIFYFLLGIILAAKPSLAARLARFRPLFLSFVLSFILLAISQAQTQLELGTNVIDVTAFTRLSILGYASAVILLLLLPYRLPQMPFYRLFVFIGRHSYLIYLSHTFWLRSFLWLVQDQPVSSTYVLVNLAAGLGIIASTRLEHWTAKLKSRL